MCIKRERRQDNIFVIHFHFRCMRHYIKTKMYIIIICSNLIFFCSKISWRYSGGSYQFKCILVVSVLSLQLLS